MTRLVVFLMVLEIFNNESVNSAFKYKLEYKFEYKLRGFNTWELVPDITRREFYGNFYHTSCGNLVLYGHSGDFCHTCLCFYYVCGNIRHTEYENNSHTIDFHTVL